MTQEMNQFYGTEDVNQLTEADVFQLYGRLVEPMKKFEAVCAQQQQQEQEVEKAKNTIATCIITPIITAIYWTVVLALPFLIIFWIAGNIVTMDDGIKFASAYIDWYEDLPISNAMESWNEGVHNLLLQLLFIAFLGLVELVIMPNVIFVFPIVFAFSVLVTIVGVINAKSLIARSKKELPQRNQQIQMMVNKLNEPLSFVPPDYRFSEAIEYFYRCYCNKKADTLKEAVTLYDTYAHQRRMEESQESIIQHQVEMLKKIEYQNVQLKKIHSKLRDIESQLYWDIIF